MRAFMRRLVQVDDPTGATPVPSSDLNMVAVEGADLLLSFHDDYAAMWGYWGVAYHAISNEEALQMRENLLNDPRGYFWGAIRGHSAGPAYFTGNPTPGGTHAGLVPYDYTDFDEGEGLDDYIIRSRLIGDGIQVQGYPWYSRLQQTAMDSPEGMTSMINRLQGLVSREFVNFRPEGREIIVNRINEAIRNV